MATIVDTEEVDGGWRVTRRRSGSVFDVQVESIGINRWFQVSVRTPDGSVQTCRALVSNRQFHCTFDSTSVDMEVREAAVPRAIAIAIERLLGVAAGAGLGPKCEVQVTSDDLRRAELEAGE